MNILRVSIKYKKDNDPQARITSSLALRMLVNAIKKDHPLQLETISDISCDFTIDQSADAITQEELTKLVKEHLSMDDYEIVIAADTKAAPDEKEEDQAALIAKALEQMAAEKGAEEAPSDTPAAPVAPATSEAPAASEKPASPTPEGKGGMLTSVMAEIRGLVGADHFKAKAEELLKVSTQLKNMDNYMAGCKFLFSIDDGHGVSTTTRLMGELLNALGLIKKSKVVELPAVPYVDSPDVMENVKARYMQILDSCNGAGILVFDLTKCYSELSKALYREFLSEICEQPDLPLIIFRIPYLDEQVRTAVEECLADKFFLHSVPFVPMSMDELYTYATQSAAKLHYTFDDAMRPIMNDLLAKEKSDGKFYGMRTVDKVVHSLIYEKIKNNPDGNNVIAPTDIRSLDDVTAEMDGLTGEEQLHRLHGLEKVIQQIEEVISFIEYAHLNPGMNPSFHMRFVGNPGTGKTTVARILGKILKEKGILRTGVFFEYSGNDFVAKYVGHTAPKTAQMCRDAYGGILFIDEAYALSPGSSVENNASFRQEALNTLLTEMENHRTDMVVIMAGYEEELDELMQHNPGMSQRIPYTIRFENYSKEDLANIFFSMASKGFFYEEEFAQAVRQHFDTLPNNIYYSPTFSNARYVRNLYERTVSKAVLRAHMEKEAVATLTPADFQKAVEELKNTATSSSSYGTDASGATMFSEERAKIRFKDVCGQEEAKEMLAEIVDFLKHPDKYTQIGARVPRGALLYGPPGTGKTMLAKAVAGEAGVPVLTIAGSDFISSYVGKDAEKVKTLFEKARKMAPSIIFIDEIDSIGTSRSMGNHSGALMQLLTEMDGFEDDKTVIVLAATNRPDELDPALRRPGRFDREIPVELPDQEGRMAILAHYLETTAHEDGIDLKEVCSMTTGFSGADLRNIVNEAAHRALREGRDKISTTDLTESVEVVMVGYVKKNRIMSDKEKWIVCYHEIGHALVSALQTHTAPIKKITVVPRTGGALGYVMHADAEQKTLSTKTEMENRIAVCVGGRAAEEVQFGEVTTGASNDIQQATAIARSIVATYGMTDEFDMVCFDIASGGYLGGGKRTTCSEATAQLIDQKVVEIVRAQHTKALEMLREHKSLLDELASFIHEKETMTGEEFMTIFNQKMGL